MKIRFTQHCTGCGWGIPLHIFDRPKIICPSCGTILRIVPAIGSMTALYYAGVFSYALLLLGAGHFMDRLQGVFPILHSPLTFWGLVVMLILFPVTLLRRKNGVRSLLLTF